MGGGATNEYTWSTARKRSMAHLESGLETYNEDGDLEMIVTLKEYRYLKLCGSPEPFHGFSAICYGEPADNGGIMDSLPGFNAIAAVSMIGIATVFPPRVSRD